MQYIDIEYIKNQQYRNSQNLRARIELHSRFSTNPADWFRWVFDHLAVPAQGSVLEIGCGTGGLWSRNSDRIPRTWHITLSDLSAGMLRDARRNTRELKQTLRFAEINAEHLPFSSQSFDAVVANHMLYHVPDRPKVFTEIQRILKPGGKLYAATNGEKHMYELDSLLNSYNPKLARCIDLHFNVRGFNLENGASQLEKWFNCLEIYPYLDSLQITDALPLVAYIRSLLGSRSSEETAFDEADLEKYIAARIKEKGALLIQKSSGLFVALN